MVLKSFFKSSICKSGKKRNISYHLHLYKSSLPQKQKTKEEHTILLLLWFLLTKIPLDIAFATCLNGWCSPIVAFETLFGIKYIV